MQPYSEGTFDDVAKYKFEQAEDDLEAAKLLLEAGKYKAANNRAYYSCFHAIDVCLPKSLWRSKSIKIPLVILIKIMYTQRFFRVILDEKFPDLR